MSKYKSKGFYQIQTMFDDGGAMIQYVDQHGIGSPPFEITKKQLEELRKIAVVKE